MRLQKHNSTSKHLVVLTALLFASKLPACAQSAVPPPSPFPSEASSSVQPADSASAPSSAPGAIEIDRVVAVVNGELILESDVNEERRFAAFQPYSNPSTTFSRADAINRLIDRTLILQQAGEQAAAESPPAAGLSSPDRPVRMACGPHPASIATAASPVPSAARERPDRSATPRPSSWCR